MRLLGNLLWIVLGGMVLTLAWCAAGLVLCCTVIFIPFGVRCFPIAGFCLWPFGREVEYGNRTSAFLANVIWMVLLGWELALGCLGVALIYFVTIIGIPFGIQSVKLAKLALMPFGARVTAAA